METNQISIRINLEAREFEITGDIKYIDDEYGAFIKECLDIIKSSPKSNKSSESTNTQKSKGEPDVVASDNSTIPDSFGEYFNKFPKGLSNVDKLLVACYYIQMRSDNKSYTVSEASSVLIDQGVKLSNPAAFNKANIETKKVFKLTGNTFRVSETGMEQIKSL